MIKLRKLSFIGLALLLQACGTYSSSSTTPAANAPDQSALSHKSPSQILVTEKDITNRKYTSLGDISVTVRKATLFDKDPTRDLVNEALQEKASEMGADAVILVRYGTVGIGVLSWGELDGDGRAVIFK